MRKAILRLAVAVAMGSFMAAPVVAQQAATQGAGAQLGSAYRINPGDELEIYVWGEERLQRQVKVLPDGTIAFPLAGQLVAQGLVPLQLQAAITEKLRGQYRGEVPQVTVSVVAPAGLQFSVIGRVKAPGTFTPGRYVNLLEALSMAGGADEFAALDKIIVVRKVGDSLTPYRLNMKGVLRGDIDSSTQGLTNIMRLESGDTVIVP